ncbi:MAG: PIN domain-containing protein [Dehalococcoidia bacterium]|nr:PIN domain-containing protein [Dehalococcoidia bacterium]MDW8120395.1 PIN domain-containing protein [Chloroflexota bacterium]
MVIVDTSVWVQFLRALGSPEHRAVDYLLAQRQVLMVGPVLAELLQGARTPQEFAPLQSRLIALPYATETHGTWLRVAELSYQLRQRGQKVGLTDLLIAALAIEHDCPVYTLDAHFQRIPGVRLYEPQGR